MLACTIIGISQEMRFDENTTLTYLMLRLPNGLLVRAGVDEDVVEAIVGQQMPSSEPARPAPRVEAPPVEETGDDVHVFGGTPAVEVSAAYAAAPPVITERQPPANPRANVQQLSNGKIVVPSKTVARNEYGYPIVPNAGVDVDNITGGINRDEDGVGSI